MCVNWPLQCLANSSWVMVMVVLSGQLPLPPGFTAPLRAFIRILVKCFAAWKLILDDLLEPPSPGLLSLSTLGPRAQKVLTEVVYQSSLCLTPIWMAGASLQEGCREHAC